MLYEMWMIKNNAAGNKALAEQSDAEREAHDQALLAAHVDTGARPLVLCDSGWANEEYTSWGITSFPNVQARIKQYQMMEQHGFYHNMEAFTLLGTAMEDPQPANVVPGLIYSLWLIRSDAASIAAYNALSKDRQDALWSNLEGHFNRLGGCWIIRCNSYWANDAYRFFGVEAFPSLEAVQEYKAELEKVDWPLYMPGISTLGTLSPSMPSINELLGAK